MKEPNCIKAERCRDWPPFTHIDENCLVRSGRGGTLGHLYPERIVRDTLNRQDGQECKKAAWLPEKSFNIPRPKQAGYDVQDHGEIQDGLYLICMDGSL